MTASINSTPRRTSLQARVRVVFWVLAAIITALALYPRLTLPEPGVTAGVTHSFNHVIAFSTLVVVGSIAWGLGRNLVTRITFGAIALELAQAFSPGRQTTLGDMIASLAGVLLGCLLVLALRYALGHRPTKAIRTDQF